MTHEWDVHTAYYTAKVPVWIDELSDVEAWREEFLKPEAEEVVQAVGAWVYCFRDEVDAALVMKAIQEVVQEHATFEAESVMLALAMPSTTEPRPRSEGFLEAMEELCIEYGFEFIDCGAHGTNEYGEKVGFNRLKEALEANHWDAAGDEEDELDLDELDFDVEDAVSGFARDEAEMTAELFGMKAALSGTDDSNVDGEGLIPPTHQAGQVDDLDHLMSKLLAIKEQSADLPDVQRKRMAAQAVRDLMGG